MNHDQPAGFTYYGKTPKGVEMALNIPVSGDAQEIAAHLKILDAALAAEGFQRSDRLEPRGFGGGGGGRQAKPDDPIPAGLQVPKHDGEPMRFIARGNRRDGTAFPPRFVCKLGNACTEKDDQGRPYATWSMHDAKGKPFKFADGAAPAGKPATPPAPAGLQEAPPPVTNEIEQYSDLLNAALGEGCRKPDLFKLAGVKTDEELKAKGLGVWRDLLRQLREGVAAA